MARLTETEKSEIIFLLGYDILNGIFHETDLATDEIFSICGDIAINFAYSRHNDPDKDLYTCLEAYCRENVKLIDGRIWIPVN